MKKKTIHSIISKKINDWANSIKDEQVKTLVLENTIVTGGCIASMLMSENVNDFDVYFRTKETVLAVAKYYVNRFDLEGKEIEVRDDEDRVKIFIQSSGVAQEQGYAEDDLDIQEPGNVDDTYEAVEEAAQNVETGEKYRPVFMSTNAITLSHKIQIVLRFYGDPEEIHKNYDFIHCTNYWDSKNNDLVLRKEALESILTKELRYVGSKYPICSIFRLRKFIRRGWSVNVGQILKAIIQISDLDLNDPSVLEDQLIGVDVAYFISVINKVKEKDPEKVNKAYLIRILEKMF